MLERDVTENREAKARVHGSHPGGVPPHPLGTFDADVFRRPTAIPFIGKDTPPSDAVCVIAGADLSLGNVQGVIPPLGMVFELFHPGVGEFFGMLGRVVRRGIGNRYDFQ